MKIQPDDCLLTIEEAAKLLTLSPATLRTYCSNGKIPRVKVLDETRILKSDAERLIRYGRSEVRADAFTARRGQSL
jgi:excisionase family DNA binding protein